MFAQVNSNAFVFIVLDGQKFLHLRSCGWFLNDLTEKHWLKAYDDT
jgi:hypothetical protein